ncbi:hypothetical protein ACOQFO_13925 [Ureibacillus sp. MALMAid1270]|uniref:hypothetical protein n=1 Tax=Ureibacillus sp. MALMAid1270 TaxID=3411629 RepID=UPI003BA4AE2A
MNTSKLLNEKGGSAVKIIAITLIVLLLFGGAITIYFQYFAKDTFSEEEIAAAKEVAQDEFGQLSTIAADYTVDQQKEAVVSLGYEENKVDKQTTIYEKKNNNDTGYYILLNLQPHDTYPKLSRALVQIFAKENGGLIYEMDNVVNWKQ